MDMRDMAVGAAVWRAQGKSRDCRRGRRAMNADARARAPLRDTEPRGGRHNSAHAALVSSVAHASRGLARPETEMASEASSAESTTPAAVPSLPKLEFPQAKVADKIAADTRSQSTSAPPAKCVLVCVGRPTS